MFSVISSRVLHTLYVVDGVAAMLGDPISFESQEEHSPIDDVSFCGLQ